MTARSRFGGVYNVFYRRVRRRLSRIPVTKRFCLIVILELSTACVSNRPYRLGGIADEFYPDQKPFVEETAVGADRSYRLSYIEFDEKGDFWDRRQLGREAGIIKRSTKPVLLVIFIHGWHHNAADRKPGGKNPGDVETFRCLLSQLAVSESTRQFQVHGVYIGWRGRLVQGPLDYLTFLGRKAAATRIAGTPVTETLFELIRQARKNHPGQAKCIVIGHSFGALVLEKAMAQALAGGVLLQDAERGGGTFNAPADLILLVNSAAESIYAKELRDMFARIQHRGSVSPRRPLIVSMTSETDTATSGWFPRGTFLPNLFARRQYHWDTKYGASSHEVNQHEYLTTTAGNNARLSTHEVRPIPRPANVPTRIGMFATTAPGACAEANPAFELNLQHPMGTEFATSDPADPEKLVWWEIVQTGANPGTPYWVLRVPDQIIHGHSPIFTPQGRAMMAALFRITNPQHEEGPRQMSLSP
jgi:hypothetical protein